MSEWVAKGNEGEGCTSFGRPCSLVGQLVACEAREGGVGTCVAFRSSVLAVVTQI